MKIEISIKTIVLLASIFLCGTSACSHADPYETLKQRIQLRASAVALLKQRGVIHEGSQGLLEPGSPGIEAPQTQMLEEENSDRNLMFQLIAARCGKQVGDVKEKFVSLAIQSPVQVTPSPNSTSPVPVPTGPASTPKSSPTLTPAPLAPDIPAPANKPIHTDGSVLPLKVITRPLSAIYQSADEHSQRVSDNTAAFTVFYVYAKENGWYCVGNNNHGAKLGWMKASDVVEWKQNLVVEFTHPEGRQPVLLFKGKDVLSGIASQARPPRQKTVTDLMETINRGALPADFPVTSMEPRRAVASENQLYLLPIVGFEDMEIDGREGRLLQLAATTRLRGASDLHDEKERAQLNRPTDLRSDAAKKISVDLVFVMDLTRSMGPFADRTLEMMRDIAHRVGADKGLLDAVRFGFWGYRDDPEKCPGIEFNTKNYTPELQELPDFVNTLLGVKETKVDSVDYPEDVFAGVADAINETAWRPGAMRLAVLVGDAPGRGPGESDPLCHNGDKPEGTKSETNAEGLRALADSKHVYVTSLYLQAPKWGQYAEEGTKQFRIIARNPNLQGQQENVRVLNASDTTIYGSTAESVGQGIVDSIHFLQGNGGVDPSAPGSGGTDMKVSTVEQGKAAGTELARNMFRGAVTEWLGKQDAAMVPRDITAWASDKDLADPAIQSLDVKVFMTKSELNGLKLVLDQLLNAGIRGHITGEDFFQSLQAVVAATARDPSQVRNASTLAQTGLIPEFLKGLPYKSTVMNMTNEVWTRMSPDAQDKFMKNLQTKIKIYQSVHDNSAKWQSLNDGDDQDNWVASVPLEDLP